MDKVKGINLTEYPFSSSKKIADLWYYDEPILSHFKFEGADFLHYLIDFDDYSSRYLIVQIGEYDLYKFIFGVESLKNTFFKSKETFKFQYVVDISVDESYDTYQVQLEELKKEYLPNDKSNYNITIENIAEYQKLKRKYSETYYIEQLRRKAYYLKFEPVNGHHDTSLGLVELGTLLNLVSTSFKNFSKIDFYNTIGEKISNKNKLTRIFNKVKGYMEPRAVEFNYGSFEIGIAADQVLKKGVSDNKDVQLWLETVEEKYQETVLEVDYNDEELITKIITENNYSEKDLESIYKPILTITQDNEYSFEYKPNRDSKFRKIKSSNEGVIDRLISVKQIESISDVTIPTIEYYTAIIPVESGKSANSKIKLENTLFDSINSFVLENKNFSEEGYNYDFEIKLEVELSSSLGKSVLKTTYENVDFDVSGDSIKLKELRKKLIDKIAEYIANKDEASN